MIPLLPFCWPSRRMKTYFNEVKAMQHETDGGLNIATRYRRWCSDTKKMASLTLRVHASHGPLRRGFFSLENQGKKGFALRAPLNDKHA